VVGSIPIRLRHFWSQENFLNIRPVLFAMLLWLSASVSGFAASQTLTTTFTYTATVPAPPPGTKALNVWLPVPSDSAWQKVSHLSVSSPVPFQITREKKYGDRMVALHETNPTGPLSVTVRFTVCRQAVRVLDHIGLVPQDTSLKPVLAANRRVPVGGQFRVIAQHVSHGERTPLDKEHALFNNVVATMHYDYHHQSPEYAQGDSTFVCDYKSGNCSDLHSYLVSLSRSLGIPAVLDFGFPLTGIPTPKTLPTDGTISGYHCWVWFHTAKHGWVPLDAADARRWQDAGRPDVARSLFGNLILERTAVSMSRGRDIVLSPPQKAAPLNYFIYPYAEADGAPTPATWTLTYHLPTGGKS
jgi:transglutaminase-like putative cysteine protease